MKHSICRNHSSAQCGPKTPLTVHVGDRESDIYELYYLAKDLGTHFVVRTVVDRLAGSGDHTVKSEMREAPSAGTHSIQVRTDDDTVERVTLDIADR
jgi:hypothetical protein